MSSDTFTADTAQDAATETPGRRRPRWSLRRAAELYRVGSWGDGFFVVNREGHVAVRPDLSRSSTIDISEVVEGIRSKGIKPPVLIRFQDVLRARVRLINSAFAEAISDSGYRNDYRAVYPIKVNQLHEVVDEVIDAGREFGMGLECGSKAELIATLPQLEHDETLLICNGVKDATMLRLILAAQRLGKNVVPVIENYLEFQELIRLASDSGIEPNFGVRLRLSSEGAGRWQESAGQSSKFGLSTAELVELKKELERSGKSHCLQLVHFHLGSQIPDIQVLKAAVKEATQIYAHLVEAGLGVRYLDVGGGVGVNYDAGYYPDETGINYSLQEYANAVVYTVVEVCEDRGVQHPVLVSESGRAITAHHSVLVVEALGADRKAPLGKRFRSRPGDHPGVRNLYEIWRSLTSSSDGESGGDSELLEAFHDAVELSSELDTRFALGYLDLEQKALAERLYWSICSSILEKMEVSESGVVPAELKALEEQLVDNYLCDFSVFQSILDHWAIGQAFPVMPLERLKERPTRRAVLVDLTCDSDGKVRYYVSGNPDRHFIELHALEPDKPYYLGFFLMGAYQDIMGDAHNLFGRVPEVHVYADEAEPGGYYVEKIIRGTRVEEMLAQVQYFPNDLHRRMNDIVRRKVEEGAIRPREGVEMLDQYMQCFDLTTYVDGR